MSGNDTTAVARSIIGGQTPIPPLSELKPHVALLKASLEFGLARKVLVKAREVLALDPWVVQQLALCTYKDEELLPATRFRQALDLLEEIGLRKTLEEMKTLDTRIRNLATLSETQSLGGAVYKRMWEHGGQLEDLHEALAFYRAAWDTSLRTEEDSAQPPSPPRDYGYSAVNAAFILDILASRLRVIATRTGSGLDQAGRLSREARALREDALDRLQRALTADPALEQYDWLAVTLAELHFGLGNYPAAGESLAKAAARKPSEWEIQTTFKQLVTIARLNQVPLPDEKAPLQDWHPAWQALARLIGVTETLPALSCYRGKVGLALSGGGFRASFFHLGVLARLAEMDALRGLDVLSTVSGGSIVGAHYYLEVQHLLETKEDRDITREDYIRLVRRVQRTFFHGVRRNLRTRALANLRDNVRMISKSYSRSHRMGELYEAELYRSVEDDRGSAPRVMPQLLIKPAGAQNPAGFKPKFSNWRRRAKVPVLLINTTALNSGHSWHFTARWMGEPPGLVDEEVDMNERYRRLWYEQAPKRELREYRLGYAVAASACVPALFEPLVIHGLYPGRTVRLVDGGVHDNQGVEGLLNEGCTLALCSDASGQMGDERSPSDGAIGVLLRSNGIFMARVREAQYQDLRSRLDGRSLQGLFFVHLKKGLEVVPLDWIQCQDPTVPPAVSAATTDYGVDKQVQRKLSAVRTDLDTFTEVEAYALMLSGYLMTEHEFKGLQKEHELSGEQSTWGGYSIDAPRGPWPFLWLKDIIRLPLDSSDARRQDLEKQLDASALVLFKIWKLNPSLRAVSIALGLGAILLVEFLVSKYWGYLLQIPGVTIGRLVLLLALLVLSTILPIIAWLNPQKAMRWIGRKALLALAGCVLANLHLCIFDRMYLKRGRLKRLLRLSDEG